jgi:isopenicillin N synthase-like dioxygenase
MKFVAVDYKSPSAATVFSESLRTTGFGIITNHPIDRAEIESLYKEWEAFFLSEEKMRYLADPTTQQGYVPQSLSEIAKGYDAKDLKEFYNFYDIGVCPESLRERTFALYQKLTQIGSTLLQWIEAALPDEIAQQLTVPLYQMIMNSHQSLFRINYYPALTGHELPGSLRAQAHADIDLLTVLTAGSAEGLQANDINGVWHDIPCDPNTIIINAGDMLEECTQGFYPSTQHRVLNPIGKAALKPRMSCPLFLHPRPDVVLSSRYTADSYLHERLVELGLRT